MRFECCSFDDGMMECDGLDSRSVQVGLHVGSEENFGVGVGVEFVSPEKTRVKKMDSEEKKSGSKKRSKGVKIGFNSDDDEPIGALIKLKSKRNSKKVKTESDRVGEKGKDVDVRDEEKLVVEDEDLGGMNDTLASFRKKLKGPKKESGSGVTSGRSLSVDVAEPSGQSLNGPTKVGVLGMETEVAGKVQVTAEDGSERKGKIKRSKSELKPRKTGCHNGFHDDFVDQGFGEESIRNQKECALGSGKGSNPRLDGNSEDSLSAFFQKAQSGLTRKSHSNLRVKQRKENQPATNRSSSNNAPVDTDTKISSSEQMNEKYPEAIVTDSVRISSIQRSQSCLSACSSKITRLKEGEVDRPTGRIQDHLHDGDYEEFLSVKVKDGCSLLSQDPTSEFQNVKGGLRAFDLANEVVEMPNSTSVPIDMEKMCQSDVRVSSVGISDAVDQQPNSSLSVIKLSSMDQEICSSYGKEGQEACFPNDLLNRLGEDTSQETVERLPGKIFECSAKPHLQYHSTRNEKMDVAPKIEVELDFHQSLKSIHSSHLRPLLSALATPNKEGTSSDFNALDQVPGTCIVEPDLASVSSQKEDIDLPPQDKFDIAIQMKHQEKSLLTGDDSNHFSPELCLSQSVTSVQKCSSTVHENQLSDGVPKGMCVSNHDYLSGSGEANVASSPSTTPDRNEGHLPDPEFKDKKQSTLRARKPKKRRLGDMAYEGDADWDILIHEQGFIENRLVGDGDQSLTAREKFNSSSDMSTEAENGGAAAVSAGLKAHAIGPVEKIKFKEVLKRKGGLQEYLQCRNQILGLWSKDVSRVLPLTECGVTTSPSVDEPPGASLVREIYAFLDQSGYINVGVASEKDRTEPSVMHSFRLLKEKSFGEKDGAPDTDVDDGVSFILGRVGSSEVCMLPKNGEILHDPNQAAGERKYGKPVTLHMLDLSSVTEPDECRADELQRNGLIDAKYPNRMVNFGVSNSNPFCKVMDNGAVPVTTSEQYASSDSVEGDHCVRCVSEGRKRIIVIGAGPAGLTAARHLQRQGFPVTVLEARSRVGGRVYTDRSSLSVPVDLGASIITGVEADAATERRPDPSSLVCAQLGLELTVLNSDCPLHDIVTGQKVPADLDETLEAEYNSLLDDMLLLVAQKGEQAMKMSLEDGLEYALKKRRMARLGKNCMESEFHNSVDILVDAEKTGVDGKVPENNSSKKEILSPLERRVMDWHFANLEYGCAALLKEVSLPYWNQDDVYGGFGGAHCMIKGGYSTVVESLGEGLHIHLNHVVTDISYRMNDCRENDDQSDKVKVSTSNGREFSGDAVLITVPLGCLKAEAIKFSPPLPHWKNLSIQRLGFGVLNKVVLEFPEVFWDDSVDYFGATAEQTNQRGQCFMFWNVKKTVGAPVLIALVVGKAAIDGQNMTSSGHVNHALTVLRKLFGEAAVPDPVASVVTDWGKDPFCYGAYSYVAVGASGQDYDILGKPVENCLFFAGEATCKEHPDTVGGAMMSGLREAVRIFDILSTGNDYTAEVEAVEAAQRHSDSERNEVRDIVKRLEAVELSNALYNNSLDGAEIITREAFLQEMFSNAKTTAGRLHLAKELLNLPVEALKSFAGTKQGLRTLNSWILDSMGKDGTQLLRHCVRLLVLVSTDLLAVRLSGIGKTVKEKVCVHTSRDIRAIASQLVNMWIEVFRKEKASNGGLKLLRQSTAADSLKSKSLALGKPPLRMHHVPPDNKGSSQNSASGGSHLASGANMKRVNVKPVKLESRIDSKLEVKSSRFQDTVGREDAMVMSEEEQAAFAAAEAARAAALAAAEAYASSEAKCNTSLPLPKILSFHKFARREQYTQMDDSDIRRKCSGGALGRQDCISEIDSRNCRVREWSVDFSAACVNLDNSKMSVDNLSQRSHSNEIACQLTFREQSAESAPVDSSIFTKAWVDASGSVGVKDYNAIDRWQSQAAAAESDYLHRTMQIRDEEDSSMNSKPPSWKHEQLANESSVSQVTVNKELVGNQHRGAERIKQAVVDYVASLLMPLYKAKKIDKEGYKSIMKKTATKVMETTTDAEKAMAVYEFLDFKRKNKIRAFVDKLIERHMAGKPVVKP